MRAAFQAAKLEFEPRTDLEPYRLEYSKARLSEIFESHSVRRVNVIDLLNQSVPKDFSFFNPDFDADEMLKAIINEDLQHLEEAQFYGQDIQETKIAKGLTQAGTPSLIEAYDENEKIRQWRSSTQGRVTIDIDTSAPQLLKKDLNRLLDVVHKLFGDFSERLVSLGLAKAEGDLTLSVH